MENPATELGFVWECDGNSFEEKNVLEDSLPEGFKYKINKFKVIEKSDIKKETKFQAEFVVNIRQCHRLTVILGFVRRSPQPSESVCRKCMACKKHHLHHQSS